MVVAYLRVSTERQHLINQQNEIRKFAESRGLKVDRWVTEVVSGKRRKEDRKLGKALSGLRSGDVLIVTELSRLSRTLYEIMSVLNRCLQLKITVYSTKDGYAFDDSINSKVLAFAFGLVAEIERNLISLRTREALDVKRIQGVRLGRPPGSKPKQTHLREHWEMMTKLLDEGESIVSVCQRYGIARSTFYEFRRNEKL